MEPALSNLCRVFATLWLGCALAFCAGAPDAGQLLVELEAVDFVTGGDHWPQHTAGTGIPGHFIPRGSPTRQAVGGAPAVVFDGDGDAFFGPITTAALHGPGATYTVEVWVFQGNIRDQESVVSWGRRGGPDATFAGFRYGADPDFGAVALWASAETGFKTLPSPGRWHHLVFTYDGQRETVYVDGNPDTRKDVGLLDAHDTLPILLGAELSGDLALEGKFTHFSGALAKVRIHRGALDAAAVLKQFQAESPRFPGLAARPLARPPEHRFSCNAAAGPAPDGTAINDSIGGLAAVVRGGGARFTGSGVRLPGGSSATAAYLDLPNHSISCQENVTIELWVTQEAALDWCRILSIGTNRSGEIPAPGGTFFGSETLTLFGNVGAAPINRFARSEGILLNGGPDRDPADYPETELGTRFHQAIIYDKALAEWRWYRNGVLMEVIPDAEGPLTLDDVNVWLGRSEFSADNNFRGIYHEVRIHNRTLEEGEIFGNYQAGPTRLNLAKPLAAAQWCVGEPGSHAFTPAGHWTGGHHPEGIGATATFAKALAGDQAIELDAAITLGTLQLGARNGGGALAIIPRGGGSLTLDSGPAGPASLAQLPRSLQSVLEVPVTLASDVEIANLAESPLLLAGPVYGRGSLIKTGPGPVIITGDGGSYQGEARVLTGELVLGNAGASGTLGATRFSLAEAGSLVMNHRDDLAVSPVIDGSGRFAHQGPGRLTLTEQARLTTTGFIDAEDGAGPLVSAGSIEGAFALRTDTAMVLESHSRTRVREYLGIGYYNGGHLTIRAGADVTLTGGQGALIVGDTGSGHSVLAMEGGTVRWKELYIGKQAGTSGVLLQSGGDLTRTAGGGDSRVGGAIEGSHQVWGAWRLSGGTFSTDANLQIGAFGLGLMEVDGGTATVRGFLGIGRFKDAQDHPSHGLVDVTAGLLATTAADRLLLVGEEGIGVLNVRGHGEVRCANQLIIGAGTLAKPGSGTVNLLRGGVLTVSGIGQFNQSRASGSLYCDGGLLQAAAANPAFLDGLDSAFIGPGGLYLRTNGSEITVAQPLLAPSGDGVKALPVTTPGSGYLAPPLIEITGGGGSGATAVAKLTDDRIREITITNPGCGYTSPPAVGVLGGGSGNGLATGTPVLQPNKSGGLTKTGPGTLVLTGASTYTSPTVIEQGELRVNGDLSAASGAVRIAKGATLGGSGRLGGSIRTEPGATLAPGAPWGVLTVGGDVVLQGTLAIVTDGSQGSRLAVGGVLDLTRARLSVRTRGATPARQAHVIATYGTLCGRFVEGSLPPGFTLDYHHDGRNQLAMVPTAATDGK